MNYDVWLLLSVILACIGGVIYVIDRAVAPALVAFAVAALGAYFLVL